MKEKFIKIILGLIVLAILAFSVLNKVQLQKCKRMYDLQKSKNTQMEKAVNEIKKAVVNAGTYSMMHLGKKINWGNMEKIYPAQRSAEIIAHNPKLVLIFSELGCNVCQDDETRFAVGFANQLSKDYVFAVVHASNKRYVRNYIRMNQVNFPVYFCEDNTFLDDNEILNTPMIFVIDENDQIIASHFPIPGHPEYSEPMHQFCYHYFNKEF